VTLFGTTVHTEHVIRALRLPPAFAWNFVACSTHICTRSGLGGWLGGADQRDVMAGGWVAGQLGPNG